MSAALSLLITALAALFSLPAPALGAGEQAALLYTNMRGVGPEEKDPLWKTTREVLSGYYALLPDERVLPAQEKAQAAGCEGEACLRAIQQELGVPVVLQLTHIDEGYFNTLKMMKVSGNGTENKDYMCSRCTLPEFKVVLNRLARKFEHE